MTSDQSNRFPAPAAARVFAVAAVAGFLVGAFVRPTWTDNVESAQVLAGVVSYPQRTPMYDYHTSVYSLTIQAAALLLRLGVPEWPLSVAFSGLQAALSFGALALLGLAVSGRAGLALLMPLLFLRMRDWCEGETTYIRVLHGHMYPNVYPNDMGIYGVVGLFSVLLIFALFAAGKVKPGALLLGLLPGLHPGLALPCFLGVGAALLFLGAERVAWLRAGWRPGLVGLAVSVVGALVQMLFFWDSSPGAPPAQVKAVMEAFLRSWEDHNFLLREGERLPFFETEVYLAALGLAALTWGRSYLPRATRAALAGLMVVAAVAVAYTFFLNWRPELVPWPIRNLLIMRWLNLSSLAFPVLGLGLLGRLALERRNTIAALVLVVLGGLVVFGFTRSLTAASGGGAEEGASYDLRGLAFPVGMVAAVCLLLPLDRARWTPRHPPRVSVALSALALAVGGAFFVLGPLSRVSPARVRGVDVHTEVLNAARGRPGFLLVATDLWNMGRPQTRTRRAVLLDPTQLNMITKIPKSGPRMADILLRVYGIDVFQPPGDSGGLWADLDLERWRQIRHEFGVTDVLAYSGQGVRLPVVFAGPRLTLHAIPP